MTKKIRRSLSALALSIMILVDGSAQHGSFSRGVNVTERFQAENANQIQFTKYTKKDFEEMNEILLSGSTQT
jgi:hypothetical protein